MKSVLETMLHLRDVRTNVHAVAIVGIERLLVFFRVASDTVEILRVIHNARNIDDLEDEILSE